MACLLGSDDRRSLIDVVPLDQRVDLDAKVIIWVPTWMIPFGVDVRPRRDSTLPNLVKELNQSIPSALESACRVIRASSGTPGHPTNFTIPGT